MKDELLNDQIKSKDRVTNFGEVNTSNMQVNSMLDLVKQETERIESRFLEPACGDGNFLIEVLDRKSAVLVKNFKINQYDFEKNTIVAIGSIYGVDILEDNVKSTRDKLFDRFIQVYKGCFKDNLNHDLIKSVKFILEKNIIHGDSLTLKQVDSDNPITFSEWSIINNKLKRRDFTLSELLAYSPFEKGTLFSDMGDEVIIPRPFKEYPLIKFDKLYKEC